MIHLKTTFNRSDVVRRATPPGDTLAQGDTDWH